jgi:tetrahydromethanopterin S-methyltransferase subunit H
MAAYDFRAEQQQFQIGGVKIGGQPGKRRTVLIGSIFYKGDGVVLDEASSRFNRDEAEKLIRQQEDFAKRTSNPCMLDVVAGSPEAMQCYLEFAAATTEMPFLIDGTTPLVRQAGLDFVVRSGLQHRAVYNSVQPTTTDDELKAVVQARIESAIFLTYRPGIASAADRVALVAEMLPRLGQAGIKNVLVDACVIDLPSLGASWEAMQAVKNQLGLPVGGGVHNALSLWRSLRSQMGPHAYQSYTAAVAAATATLGADFILYGPIKDAPYVFPAVAMIDNALACP